MASKTPLHRKVATSVWTEAGVTSVKYHNTIVVQFDDDLIHLDTGGWFTVTTKRRMDEVSDEFGLNYRVYQRKFKWFVARIVGGRFDESTAIPFDGETVTIPRHVSRKVA